MYAVIRSCIILLLLYAGKAVQSSVGRIALVMCLGCASAGIVQTLVSGLVQMYKRDETFNSNEIANVILSALVAVTGCCPFIEPYYALIIGGRVSLILSPIILFTGIKLFLLGNPFYFHDIIGGRGWGGHYIRLSAKIFGMLVEWGLKYCIFWSVSCIF